MWTFFTLVGWAVSSALKEVAIRLAVAVCHDIPILAAKILMAAICSPFQSAAPAPGGVHRGLAVQERETP